MPTARTKAAPAEQPPAEPTRLDALIQQAQASPSFDPCRAVLATKIAIILGMVERIPKNGYNDHFKYHFATETDVSEAIRAKLAELNLAVFTSTSFREIRPARTSRDKPTLLTDVDVTIKFVCGDTGAEESITGIGTGDDPSDKGTYKGTTGAVKYSLLKSFLIATGDDPEASDGAEDRAATGGARRRDPGVSATGNGPPVISAAQRRMLMAEINELEINLDAAREVIAVSAGVFSTKDIPKSVFSDLRADLKGYAANPEAGDVLITEWREAHPDLAEQLDAKLDGDGDSYA